MTDFMVKTPSRDDLVVICQIQAERESKSQVQIPALDKYGTTQVVARDVVDTGHNLVCQI